MVAVLYFGKMILTSGTMFLYYQLLLKDKTFHHYNRFYLLGTMFVSLLLPLLKVNFFTIEVNEGVYSLIGNLKQIASQKGSDNFYYFGIFASVFGWVSIILAIRFCWGILKIIRLRNRFPREKFEGVNFYQTDLHNAPFSYFRNLFWKNSIQIHSDLGKQILKHEMVHIEQKHTYDKILIEIIRAVFWFNPFFHLIRNEIHLIHEYLADKEAVRQSDTKALAQMLLASHFSGHILPASSPLLSANLKKRLQMFKTPETKFSYMRRTFALPLLFAIVFVYVVNAKNREINAANIETAQAVNANTKAAMITRSGIISETKGTRSITKYRDRGTAVLERRPKQPKNFKDPAAKSTEFYIDGIAKSAGDMKLLEKEVESIKDEAAKAEGAAQKARENANLARKQAELAKKQAELAKKQMKIS